MSSLASWDGCLRSMMLASWRNIIWLMRRADIVLEVVDIRDPIATHSRRLQRLAQSLGKGFIVVLNKADLVPLHIAKRWKSFFEERGLRAVYVAAREHKGTRVLRKTIRSIATDYPIVVVVMGFPKTGKSTIINALKGRHSASTSPVPGSPGYTRHSQLYRIGRSMYMIDTPGILPYEGGWLESVIRGKPPEQLDDPVRPAVELIKRALKYNPQSIKEAYGIESRDPYEILKHIALKRGWRYKSDGEPLIEEAARALIRDYHKGKLLFYVPPEEYTRAKISRPPER